MSALRFFSLTRWIAVAGVLLASVARTQAADLPNSAELQYAGPYGVSASMTFNRNGSAYNVVARLNAPFYPMRFESAGTIAGNTLRPTIYTDNRRGKNYAQARFLGNKVSFGKVGETPDTALMRNPVFDLFSLTWQLAMNDVQLPAGLQITNGKKLYPVSQVRKLGSGQYRLNGKDIKVERYRVQREGSAVEYSFAPEYNNIPVEATWFNNNKSYAFKLTRIKFNGKDVT